MSALPGIALNSPLIRYRVPFPVLYSAFSITLAVLGLSTIWPTVRYFWRLWTTDPLQSIGIAVPLVSLILILRVWKRLNWRVEGSWWGLVLLVFTAMAVRVGNQTVMVMVVSSQKLITLPPPQLIVWMYGSGVVLLFGGTRLYRAALFPVSLLLLVNPVPHVFYPYVDLPLQQVSAHMARGFAMSLGQPLTADQLRLMFTPEFGMFIAPGCNGIRGSVTMGLIALIAGYLYRFRWYAYALVVVVAILLGYVFNLLRLCLLVLYYVLALRIPALQNHAENADYLIGAALFSVATLLLFAAIHRLREVTPAKALEAGVSPERAEGREPAARFRFAPLAAMGVFAAFGCIGVARASAAIHPTALLSEDALARAFPVHLGSYTLTRSWSETLLTGAVVYTWGQYAPAGGGTPIAIGISPGTGWHNPTDCHSARGETPLWQGQLTVSTADAAPVQLSSAFYSDGATRHLEASTLCGDGSCDEYRTKSTRFGFIFSRPHAKTLLRQEGPPYIPLLLRAEAVDMSVPETIERQELTEAMRAFLAHVRLNDLAGLYAH